MKNIYIAKYLVTVYELYVNEIVLCINCLFADEFDRRD